MKSGVESYDPNNTQIKIQKTILFNLSASECITGIGAGVYFE